MEPPITIEKLSFHQRLLRNNIDQWPITIISSDCEITQERSIENLPRTANIDPQCKLGFSPKAMRSIKQTESLNEVSISG